MCRSIQVPPQQLGTVAAAAASSSSAPVVDAKALAAALGNISSGQVQMQRAPGPNLADVLTPEVIIPLLRQPGVLERLAPHLPVRRHYSPLPHKGCKPCHPNFCCK